MSKQSSSEETMKKFLHASAHRSRVLLGACASIALVLATLSQPARAARTPEPLSDDAMQASIDPATGRLARMSAEDARSLAADMARTFDRSPETLAALQQPDGTLMIIERAPGGSYVTFCAPEREIPAVVTDPGVPSILLPVWATLPRANLTQPAGFSGLEEK
jgi:hypothetical protein